ncbi:unnamed protein product [Larinioides sclopetarius]|uniref:Uncharacterized protein n=1 Tax=Larinioides sclopetarius TaxID=280406 RepID=A0AAV2ANY5_9ARAC
MYFRFVFPLFRRNSLIQNAVRSQRRTLKTVQESELKDEPIKFSTSEAGQWKAAYTARGKDYYSTPKVQPLVVVTSLTAFMIYFCILREENDLDDWLRVVEKDIPYKLEEAELRAKIDNARQQRTDTSYYEKRLEEIVAIRGKLDALKEK